MITFKIKCNDEYKNICISEDWLFNSFLIDNEQLINRIIKNILPTFKIKKQYFTILNKYIDFDGENAIYPGLIVRTGLTDFVILYLEKSEIDEEYTLKIIMDFLYDTEVTASREININKIEVDKKSLINATKNI